ncbi:MAG: protein kinase [Lentimicrobium sp.]|nr:protein kinase [Lentimicrobium sp.]
MFKNLFKRIKAHKQHPSKKGGDGKRETVKAKNTGNNIEAKADTVLRNVEPLNTKSKSRNLINPIENRKWDAKTIPELNVGDTIDSKYIIAKKFTGGMGFVYITEATGQGIRFAIKQPNKQMLSHKSLFSRIITEANEWTNLGMHPHIAYCYFVKALENIPYIFIEYVEGGNLREWIADGKCIDIRASLDMCIQFCHGMEHAHEKGMKHRDIKPENILMTKEGKVKITDFGLAGKLEKIIGKQALQNEGQTQVGDIMGTKAYMSPEQWVDPHNVDERADVFSFGVCMWEMLCGCRPYTASIGEISPPPDIVQLRDDLPGKLIELLYQVIALNKEERPRNFIVLRDQINLIYKTHYKEESPFYNLELADTLADELNNKGFSYYQLGNFEKAIDSWKEALKIDPLHFEANYNYGYQMWNMGELSGNDYIKQIENCTEITKQRDDYWIALAWLYFEQGNLDAVKAIQASEHRVNEKNFLDAVSASDKPVVRLIKTFKGHTEYINSLAFSSDGEYVLSGSQDKSVRLWKVSTGAEVRLFMGHTKHVRKVNISHDGNYAVSCDNNFLKKWDIKTGEELKQFKFHVDKVETKGFGFRFESVTSAISPDCRYALSGSDDKIIRLWDISSGKELMQFKGHEKAIASVAFSPDGKYILSGSYDQTLRLWEISTGAEIKVFEDFRNNGSASFSPDGRYIISGGLNESVKLWDISTSKIVKSFNGLFGIVGSVSITQDSKYALSVDYSTVRIWEISNGKELRQINKKGDLGRCGIFSPNGRFVIFGNNEELMLWEINFPNINWDKYYPHSLISITQEVSKKDSDFHKVKKLLKEAKLEIEKQFYVNAFNTLNDVRNIEGYERNLDVLDFQFQCAIKGGFLKDGFNSAWCENTLYGHNDQVKSLSILPDGKHVLSGSEDKTLRLWEISTGKEIHRFLGHLSKITAMAVSHDGNYAVSASSEALIIWDIVKRKEKKRFIKITGFIYSIVFSKNSKYLFTGDLNNGVLKWDISTGTSIMIINVDLKSYPTFEFSPDGTKAVYVGKDEFINLYNLSNGSLIKRFKNETCETYMAAIPPDGKHILSSGGNSYCWWNVSSNRSGEKINGQLSRIYRFTLDSRYIFAVSSNNTFKLWEISSGKDMFTFYGHTYTVNSIVITPDGKYVISGSSDNTIRLWRLDWNWVPPPPKKDFDLIKNKSFSFLNLIKYSLQKIFQ